MNKTKRDQLLRDVQHWLSPPDPSVNQDFINKARHEGTASWFFRSNVLAEWKAGGSLLWIHGKPGSGKSTLLSAIIQDVKRMHAAGLATMAYYYFDFRDIKKQDCYGLLSSLISQLAAESDSCYNILSHLYSDNSRGTRKPDVDALNECLAHMLNLSGQGPIYIIIDALDECPNFPGRPSAREEVLELIEELVYLNLPNVHLCVASRPKVDIQVVLEPLTYLKISLHDERGQKEDIIAYIKSVVYSNLRWREEDKRLVVDTLSDKADGMFRWVVCQVNTLCRALPASIRIVLEDLPESLDETYGRTLLGIAKENRQYAKQLFQCLMVSIRPLRVEELAEVLAIQFYEAATPTFNADWRPENPGKAVLSVCSSLIAIVEMGGHQVVQFSHFSVKEYLTSERLAVEEERLSYYHILPEVAHTFLAYASLSVLLQLDDKIDRNIIAHFPLAPYAARHWVDHAQFRNVSAHIQEVLERLFNPKMPHFAAWVWLHDIDRRWIQSMPTIHPTPPEAMPLYYASLCGFRALTNHLITAHPSDVHNRGGSLTTALHAASVKGHLEVASLLLINGADPNSRDHLDRVPLHRVQGTLHASRRYGHLDLATLLIDHGADVNVRDIQDWTPLHHASRYGCLDLAKLLIDRGADVNVYSVDHWTPLHVVSHSGHLDIAKLLIDHGADVNSRKDKQETSLDLASRIGHLEIVRILIENGAELSARDDDGWTPFHTASYFGHLHVAKFLLARGIDADIRNGNEETPLYLASSSGKVDVVRFLIEQGADTHVRDNNDWNPVHIASHNGYLDVVHLLIKAGTHVDILNGTQETPLALASKSGKVEVGRFLIDQGADVSARDKRSRSPFHLATQYGHLDMALLLLNHGVDANIQKDNLWSPLHLASAHGHLRVALLLVQRGARIDLSNGKKETPLHLAAGNGRVDIVRLLIAHGATLRTANNNGWAPLHSAARRGHLGVVKLLLLQGACVDALNKANKTAATLASENGQAEIAKFILQYKVNAKVRTEICPTTLDTAQYGSDDGRVEGSASLHTASAEGQIDVVESLLEQGSNVNAGIAQFRTSLHVAPVKGKLEVVDLLIKRGAEVDPCDMWGWVPLHFAARFGHLEVSRVLIDHGANVNARNQDHWTPIHLSAGNGHLGTVKLLLERGADVYAVNGDGKTPYQIAQAFGYGEIADLFLGHGEGKGE